MSRQIRASCLCGQLVVTSTIPDSKLPIDLYLCSCNTCRWLSGTLAISAVNSHEPISIQGEFTRYATSTGPRGLDRCFCPVCGTYVFEDCPDVSRIGFFGGAVENLDASLVKLKGIIYAASTLDGGLATWMPGHTAWVEDPKGKNMREYQVPKSPAQNLDESVDLKQTLQCTCLCGNVHFEITRPNEESYKLSAQYSDSLVPFHTGEPHLNLEDKKWWICGGEGRVKKYAAAVCACDSCRKASGQDLAQWAFVPTTNIIMPRALPLGEYQSSKGIWRSFCKTCGARVFWKADHRPGLIDVAVGLMRSERGSRAEDWLEWLTQRVSFVEDAKNEEIVHAVRDGMMKSREQVTKQDRTGDSG